MEKNFENKNTEKVMELVKAHIERLEKRDYARYVLIDRVYDELSIFDWWKNTLSLTDLKNMYRFLNIAHKLGYNGYVCFKVGCSGCSNGMWASKETSTDGYSPDGDFIYRSFTPDYISWDAEVDGELLSEKYKDSEMSLQKLKGILAEQKGENK